MCCDYSCKICFTIEWTRWPVKTCFPLFTGISMKQEKREEIKNSTKQFKSKRVVGGAMECTMYFVCDHNWLNEMRNIRVFLLQCAYELWPLAGFRDYKCEILKIRFVVAHLEVPARGFPERSRMLKCTRKCNFIARSRSAAHITRLSNWMTFTFPIAHFEWLSWVKLTHAVMNRFIAWARSRSNCNISSFRSAVTQSCECTKTKRIKLAKIMESPETIW